MWRINSVVPLTPDNTVSSNLLTSQKCSIAHSNSAYDALQAGLGLIVPAANLARALFIGMNSFDVLCGKYGDADISYPFQYVLYGGVYANFVYEIIFLVVVLGLIEYAGSGWIRPLFFWRNKTPSRLHHQVDDGLASFDSRRDIMLQDHQTRSARQSDLAPILDISRVSKFFGRSFAAQNVSLSISPNQTLALLGGNGAGKTTVINMIRGELRPDFGNIFVNGLSVLTQLRKARLNIGVCPQDDAVDNLTVRQTLEFYATVKGLQRVKENVDQVLAALNITQYEKTAARALSGGTKRKLTVAIAILGVYLNCELTLMTFLTLHRKPPSPPTRRTIHRPGCLRKTDTMARSETNSCEPSNSPYNTQHGGS